MPSNTLLKKPTGENVKLVKNCPTGENQKSPENEVFYDY